MTEQENNLIKRKKGRQWFRLLRLLGILIFFIVLSRIDLKEVWDNLKQVSLQYLLLAIFAQVLLLLAKGFRWHIIKTGVGDKKNIYQSLGEFFESYAIGVITPGRMGEFLKAGHEEKKANIFSSGIKVLAERGMDIGIFITFAGAALIWGSFISFGEIINIAVLVGGITAFIAGILLISSGKVYVFLDRFVKGISSTHIKRSSSNLTGIIFLTLISNFLYFYSCYLLSSGGLGLPISFIELSGAVAVAGLINLLPITVMGLGTREVVLLYIFNIYPESQILALSGLIFLVAQIGGGLIALIFGQIFLFLHKNSNK